MLLLSSADFLGIVCKGYLQTKKVTQGSHRLEKSLNIQDCLEKSLKIIFALKST